MVGVRNEGERERGEREREREGEREEGSQLSFFPLSICLLSLMIKRTVSSIRVRKRPRIPLARGYE